MKPTSYHDTTKHAELLFPKINFNLIDMDW